MEKKKKESRGVKIIVKRPKLHYAIIIVYVLAPVVNLLLVMILGRLPIGTVIQRYFAGFGYLAGIWLFTAPLVGIGLYFVHRVSWYIFLAHSSLIIIDYILKWALNPRFYWVAVDELPQILVLTGNVALVIAIGYIIQRDFRAPYFQVLQRGWRESERIPIRHSVDLNGTSRSVSDFSIGGCYVNETDIGIAMGEKVKLKFESDKLNITCIGEVMRITPGGYGIRFHRLRFKEKRDIKNMLKKRFALRFEVNAPGSWRFDGVKQDAKVVNISHSGCYIESAVTDMVEGTAGKLEIKAWLTQHNIKGNVVWVNREEVHEKPFGFGVRFARHPYRLVKRLVARYGTKALTR